MKRIYETEAMQRRSLRKPWLGWMEYTQMEIINP